MGMPSDVDVRMGHSTTQYSKRDAAPFGTIVWTGHYDISIYDAILVTSLGDNQFQRNFG